MNNNTKIFADSFRDVFAFRDAINTRKDNGTCRDSSKTGSRDFAGMPYDEAVQRVTDGLPEVADSLKRELTKFAAAKTGNINQRRPVNYYNGHSPNVPAAIIGLPKSMRKVVKTPSKVKTIRIFYQVSVNCDINSDDINKAGAAVLQLVYWLEIQGYRVELVIVNYCASDGGKNRAVCTICLKEFKQPLDILKLSFSLGSVSMYRRLGFRWLETVPGLRGDWARGYGSQIGNKTEALKLLNAAGNNTDNSYFINYNDCKNADFDAVKLGKQQISSDLGGV